jgi:hypothetical protein
VQDKGTVLAERAAEIAAAEENDGGQPSRKVEQRQFLKSKNIHRDHLFLSKDK